MFYIQKKDIIKMFLLRLRPNWLTDLELMRNNLLFNMYLVAKLNVQSIRSDIPLKNIYLSTFKITTYFNNQES